MRQPEISPLPEAAHVADYSTVHHNLSDEDDKREYSPDIKDEKHAGGETVVETTSADDHLHEVQDLEKRILDGTATDEEAMVRDNHDIAVKVLSTYDDPSLPVMTFRSMFLGLGFSCFAAVLAQLYYFKPQTLSVSQSFLLIMTYFFGKGWEKIMPSRGFFRYINPGPFNIKEHAVVIIMCSTAASSAVAIQVISVQDLFYDNKMNGGVAIFMLIASQCIGYGFAGLLYEICVKPSQALWPSKIPVASVFQALHLEGLGSKRTRFYWYLFTFMFVYEILPQWIFPLLGALSIVCLINHTSPVLRNVFGGGSNNEGMGLFTWSLDWNYIGSACLYTPLVTQLNMDVGILLTYLLMSSVYYGNIWRGKSFPFMSQGIFDSDGNQYNQTALLTNNRFDQAKYEEIGPAWFSATNALFLLVDNLSIGAALVHAILFYGKDLYPLIRDVINIKNMWKNGWRSIFVHEEEDASTITDEHLLQMHKSGYRSIPKFWFLIVLGGAFAMAMATNYAGDSGMPWWALIVILLISFVFTTVYSLFAGFLGFSQFVSGGTGLFQLMGSKMVPGNPVANMYFAMYGQNPQVQAIALLEDLKLGIYIKVPPRITFLYQMLGTIIGAILNYVIMLSVITQQREALLSLAGTRLWSGQNAQSYNSNAIAYGALAQQMFAAGKTYYFVPAALGIGCLLPIPVYLLHRKFPKFGFQNIHTYIIMQYSCYMSVGVNTSVNPAMVIGIFSQWFVRNRYPRAFTKYNYLFAGALDGGTQVISFILNFAVFGAAGEAHAFPEWWGNDLSLSTDRCLLPEGSG